MRLNNLLIFIIASLVLIGIIEAYLPFGVAIWILCIPFISLGFFTLRPMFPLYVAALGSIWLIFDYVVSEPHFTLSVVLIRRAIGIIAFFSVGAIVRFAILSTLKERETRKALEKTSEELKTEKQKLERSNRELEEFAGVAAHDLRSPIKTIQSWSNLLDDLIPPPKCPEIEQALAIIKKNAVRADDLVADILEIARVNISLANTESIDLDRTIKDVQLMLEKEIKSLQAQIHTTPLPTVLGNQTYLSSVFTNLIRNALIYRDKNRIPEIFIGCTEHDKYYEFFIKDNGIGIDPQNSNKIFEMFKRLHSENEYPGTGIGLAFCKKVIELSGGKIWVQSTSGLGSTFFFSYPKNSAK